MKASRRPQAIAVFERIRQAHPQLRMELDLNHAHVDVMMTIPVQPGLQFAVSLNLQNVDELHLSTSDFWVSWFPCDKPEVEAAFVDAVRGLLSGQYRVLEHHRGGRCVKAELQAPADAGWKTIATSSRLHFPFPWRKTLSVLRNVPTE